MPKSQQPWVQSKHPPRQWNLRDGRWSSVEWCNLNIQKNTKMTTSLRLLSISLAWQFTSTLSGTKNALPETVLSMHFLQIKEHFRNLIYWSSVTPTICLAINLYFLYTYFLKLSQVVVLHQVRPLVGVEYTYILIYSYSSMHPFHIISWKIFLILNCSVSFHPNEQLLLNL
jgi:hypothetical protein